MSMQIAIFVALLAAFCAFVWGVSNYLEETVAVVVTFGAVSLCWSLAGYLAEVLA